MEIRAEKVKLNSAEIKRLYLDAFPREERMPFPMMVAMSKLWNTEFWGFYDGETLCGLTYLAFNGKILFVMFLAVNESLRSKGYGSAILQEIKNRYPGKKIIITIESCDELVPDIEMRKRRKEFYLRNGFKETGYMIKLAGVVQEVIVANGEFEKKEFRSFFARYSNFVMWPKIWERAGQE